MFNISKMRLQGLVLKELKQVWRDPSSVLIAFVLPLILLFLFGYALSLDVEKLKIDLVIEDQHPLIHTLIGSFTNSRFFDVQQVDYVRQTAEEKLTEGKINGVIIVPPYFIKRLQNGDQAPIQIIADGSQPHIAGFFNQYTSGTLQDWLSILNVSKSQIEEKITLIPRYWFNPELNSRYYLIPGAIAIILTITGTLLTALVVSREWERGTMEALMATPVSILELVLGKILPYFFLGLGSLSVCTLTAIFLFHVPFRGSFVLLIVLTSLYLLCVLSIGLLISTLAKNQFIASQIALMAGFLPAFMLSGFLFEIKSMPVIIQVLTYCLPARYYVSLISTLFLAGNIAYILLLNGFILLFFACILMFINFKITRKRLS